MTNTKIPKTDNYPQNKGKTRRNKNWIIENQLKDNRNGVIESQFGEENFRMSCMLLVILTRGLCSIGVNIV